MPKAIAKYSITAWNERVSLAERITPSKAIRTKYVDFGKPRKVVKPKNKKVVTHPLTLEERLEIRKEVETETAERSLLSRLTLERRKLLLEDDLPPLPLIERISAPEYQPPAPLPNIDFHKTKILKRIKEFEPLLEATKARVDPLFKKLQEDDDDEHLGIAGRVPLDDRNILWKWFNRLDSLYSTLDTRGHELTNHEWRDLKGALKRIGKVSFKDLDSRLTEICKELVKLNITLP